MSARIVTLTGAAYPFARIESVDAEGGAFSFAWLNGEQRQVDSGGSVGKFPPTETEPGLFAEPDDATLADAIANPPPLPSPDQASIWAQKLAGRIVDSDTGIPLNASIYARNILTSHLVLLREAEAVGYVTAGDPQTIWDADNEERNMTVAQLRLLIIRYGVAWQAMHAEFAP